MFNEYLVANVSGQAQSRPYAAGRLSVDGTRIIVRFLRDETPWPNPEAEFASKEEVITRLNSAVFTPEPTPEEIAENEANMQKDKFSRLKDVINRKRVNRVDQMEYSDEAFALLVAEAVIVDEGGTSAAISEIATLLGVGVNGVKNNILAQKAARDAFMLQSEVLFQALEKLHNRDEDIPDSLVDAIRAL